MHWFLPVCHQRKERNFRKWHLCFSGKAHAKTLTAHKPLQTVPCVQNNSHAQNQHPATSTVQMIQHEIQPTSDVFEVFIQVQTLAPFTLKPNKALLDGSILVLFSGPFSDGSVIWPHFTHFRARCISLERDMQTSTLRRERSKLFSHIWKCVTCPNNQLKANLLGDKPRNHFGLISQLAEENVFDMTSSLLAWKRTPCDSLSCFVLSSLLYLPIQIHIYSHHSWILGSYDSKWISWWKSSSVEKPSFLCFFVSLFPKTHEKAQRSILAKLFRGNSDVALFLKMKVTSVFKKAWGCGANHCDHFISQTVKAWPLQAGIDSS